MRFWLCFAVSLLPSLMLLLPYAHYSMDWINHEWMINYFAEYFRQHLSFPYSLNTTRIAGLAYPVFYGFLFYPLMGLLSLVVSAAIAIRVCAVALFVFQFRCIQALFIKIGASEFESNSIAALIIWSTYSLTNLYARGAHTEFFATGLLTANLYFGFCLFFEKSLPKKKKVAWTFALIFTLAAGIHPISALYGAVFYTITAFFLWSYFGSANLLKTFRSLILPVLMSLAVLSPWLYAVSKFGHELKVSKGAVAASTEDYDSPLVRFFPIPIDVRMQGKTLAEVSTPYMDTQIHLILLIVAIIGTFYFFKNESSDRKSMTTLFSA